MNKLFSNVPSVVLAAGLLSTGVAPAIADIASPVETQAQQSDTPSVEDGETVVSFSRDGYAVTIFETDQELKMDIFNEQTQSMLVDDGSVIRQLVGDETAYIHRGEIAAQVYVDSNGSERLTFGEPIDQDSEETTASSTEGINTLLLFDRDGYAVRVFEDNRQLKMNIYNQQTQTLLVDGGNAVRQLVGDETAYIHRGSIAAQVYVDSDGSERLTFGETLGQDASEEPVSEPAEDKTVGL